MLRLLARTAFIALTLLSFSAQAEVVKLGTLVSANLGNLSKLAVGMSKDDVIKTMGTNNAETKDGLAPNPWTTETFSGKDGGKYEVLYYLTRKNPPFTPLGKFLTTPVVLKNGKVSGWGNDALDAVKPTAPK